MQDSVIHQTRYISVDNSRLRRYLRTITDCSRYRVAADGKAGRACALSSSDTLHENSRFRPFSFPSPENAFSRKYLP